MESCNIKLTELTENCGCSAKLAQGLLEGILDKFPIPNDPNLLVGFHTKDDACVYKLDENTAVIQTLDFFTPIVDDPYMYGQIAAANSLSDVFAMGGDPKLALNMLCIPHNMDKEVVGAILRGGYEKTIEAGAMLVGGHTIEDPIPKYGLSVTGFMHPDKVLRNSSAKAGDVLILTKPLGTGILTTAKKLGLVDEKVYNDMSASMAFLNKTAKDIMIKYPVSACTDITGFGFLGHLYELAEGSGLTAHITTDTLPIFPTVLNHAKEGHVPGVVYRNLGTFDEKVCQKIKVTDAYKRLLCDPQTSGGLLISVPEAHANALLSELKSSIPCAFTVGYLTEKKEKYVEVI